MVNSGPGPTLSTHVLDTASGRPAAGIEVRVLAAGEVIATGVTGADGRISGLLPAGAPTGLYTVEFLVDGYYQNSGHLYRSISFEVRLLEPGHFHLPLLLSPFGCGGYRGG